MKKAYLLGAAIAALALPSAAQAIPIIGSFTVSQYYGDGHLPGGNSNAGLEIDVSPTSGGFVSSTGSSVDLFKISTPEGSVQGDDLLPKNIFVDFLFTNPLANGTVGGQTYARTIGFLSDGYVNWSPTTVLFGNGGQFKITLTNKSFDGGPFLNLGNKPATISASFDLIKASVPEPSTWAMMILGIGAAGAVMRRRRQNVSVSYA